MQRFNCLTQRSLQSSDSNIRWVGMRDVHVVFLYDLLAKGKLEVTREYTRMGQRARKARNNHDHEERRERMERRERERVHIIADSTR